MTHSTSSQNLLQRFSALVLSVSVVLSLSIFAGTFFAYATRHKEHLPGSYLPGVVGAIAFAASMAWVNYFVLPEQGLFIRVSKALGITLLEVIVFFFLLFFLLVNTFGA